jgi:hypothetical protein
MIETAVTIRVAAILGVGLGIAACAPPPSPTACYDPSACYRMGSDGTLHPAYRPQPAEAHVIPIGSI